MATVELAKPATLGTAVLQVIRSTGGLANTIQLKLQACDIDFRQITEDTTGGNDVVADTFHTHEGSGLCGGTIALQGLLQSSKTLTVEGGSAEYLGLSNMFSTTDTWSRMRWSVGLANNIYFRGNMIVEQCRVRWVRTAATVQVTIVGKITDTSHKDVEDTQHRTTGA
jgi:hypothetical protein